MEFSKFKKAIQDHFAKLSETADHVYEVEVDKDVLRRKICFASNVSIAEISSAFPSPII